jgi:hypothetical protein
LRGGGRREHRYALEGCEPATSGGRVPPSGLLEDRIRHEELKPMAPGLPLAGHFLMSSDREIATRLRGQVADDRSL